MDRLPIETILKEKSFKRISFVVKGEPIINDATLDDIARAIKGFNR